MVDTGKWEPEFKKRFDEQLDEMKWLYGEIYNGDEQAFDYFCSMLYRSYQDRSDVLKSWDRAREMVPDWYRGNDMVGMLLYADRFAGTIKGVKENLDYLRECDVNYVHLMPLLQSPEGKSDDGYAVSDFRRVDPKLGMMEDLADLATACHEKGMCLCLDFVINHTSDEHPWAIRAKKGEKEYMDRYFFYDSWDIPEEYERTVPQIYPATSPGNFTWIESVQKPVMTMFHSCQWDLNYRNPVVFNDMVENMLFLCNQGADILRLDALPYIWKELGTTNRNLPKTHTLVRLLRMAADIVAPGTLLLGEVLTEPQEALSYFGSPEKPECHMLYNFATMATIWHTVATRDVRLLKKQLGSVFALPHHFTFLNYLRCPDDISWDIDYDFLKLFGIEETAHKSFLNKWMIGKVYGSDSRGELSSEGSGLGDARLCGTTASLLGLEAAVHEKDEGLIELYIRRILMMHAFLFTLSGIPMLYSGDEIGQFNDYSYHGDPLKCDDSRHVHRGVFDQDEAALRKKEGTRQAKIFNGIKELEYLRIRYKVFSNEADEWILDCYNDHMLAIGRYYDNEKMIALFNFNDKSEVAWINEPERYVNMLTGQEIRAEGMTIEPYGFRWMITTFQ